MFYLNTNLFNSIPATQWGSSLQYLTINNGFDSTSAIRCAGIPSLVSLSLNGSNQTNLPTEIGNIKQIQQLSINSYGQLSSFPSSGGNMTGLRQLIINNTPKLTKLPTSMKNKGIYVNPALPFAD